MIATVSSKFVVNTFLLSLSEGYTGRRWDPAGWDWAEESPGDLLVAEVRAALDFWLQSMPAHRWLSQTSG